MQYFEGESKKTSEEQLTEMLKKVPENRPVVVVRAGAKNQRKARVMPAPFMGGGRFRYCPEPVGCSGIAELQYRCRVWERYSLLHQSARGYPGQSEYAGT